MLVYTCGLTTASFSEDTTTEQKNKKLYTMVHLKIKPSMIREKAKIMDTTVTNVNTRHCTT